MMEVFVFKHKLNSTISELVACVGLTSFAHWFSTYLPNIDSEYVYILHFVESEDNE